MLGINYHFSQLPKPGSTHENQWFHFLAVPQTSGLEIGVYPNLDEEAVSIPSQDGKRKTLHSIMDLLLS